MDTKNEQIIAQFEREWRDQFSTYPPLDKMNDKDREKLKDYTIRIWMIMRGQNSCYSNQYL